MASTLDLDEVAAHLRSFASARDWEQFHTPKNLVMALAGEVGELVEVFQWLTPDESAAVIRDPVRARAVEDEATTGVDGGPGNAAMAEPQDVDGGSAAMGAGARASSPSWKMRR